ncbi:MAG: hypothetical protein NVS4B3_04910 [Gemmatimonadaceae bacterium]
MTAHAVEPGIEGATRRPVRLGGIVYLRDDDYPWDVRVEKVCATLTVHGYDVHIVARNRAGAPESECRMEGTVHRMPAWRWVPRAVDAALGFPAFFNPRWLRHLRRVMRQTGALVIIVRDVPLAPAALSVARWFGCPVVLDMAENYPAMTQETWDVRRQRFVDYVVRNPRVVAAVERWCLRRVHSVLAVVEESAARVRALGVPADRVYVVSNTPPLARAAGPARPASTALSAPLHLVYLGLLEIPRGVMDLIDAVALLRSCGRAVRATIIGDGRDAALFRERTSRLHIGDDAVTFTGYVERGDALELVGQADVGVVPHHASELWNTTVPNKLFDYMAAGLPVVTSDAVPAARIVRECNAGEVFRSGDARSLAVAVDRIFTLVTRVRCGEAGWRAVVARYHWERDARVLLTAIGRVMDRASAHGG